MSFKSATVAAGRVLTVVAGLSLAGLGGAAPAQAADNWPANMRALYDVNFNGFNIGSLEFVSQAEQQSYTLVANAKLSALLGAIKWDGQTRSFGLMAKEAPRPAAFSLDFRTNLGVGSTKMGFDDGAVTKIAHLPPAIVHPETVPLRKDHLKGVVDPLSAVMVLSRGSSTNPCERRIPIFDGRERFDLLFSYKGEMKVTEQLPSGQPGIAFVCKVKYLPIAGHKVDSETRFMAANNEIEVALRPIPAANVFVPYQISIPTSAGSATIISKRVEIGMPGKPEIALLH